MNDYIKEKMKSIESKLSPEEIEVLNAIITVLNKAYDKISKSIEILEQLKPQDDRKIRQVLKLLKGDDKDE